MKDAERDHEAMNKLRDLHTWWSFSLEEGLRIFDTCYEREEEVEMVEAGRPGFYQDPVEAIESAL